jgi:hypothetical protein
VIERAIRRLPNDVGADVEADAEAFLLDSAQALDVDDLDRAGRHLYEVIAPEDAEARIGKELEEQERRARENRTLSFGPVRDGVGTVSMRACSLFRVRRGGQDWLRREVRGLERVFGVGAGEGIGWQFG